MAERRIGYAKDKAEIIKRLLNAEDGTGPFKLIADVLVFAAAFGLRRNKRVPLGESQAEPIRQEVFDRQGYDTMMNLLALHGAKSTGPEILADSDAMIEERATIFEQYANGGLEILQDELRGALNPLETTILLINAERASPREGLEGFDLAKLV
jgi:dnd system-associated protein 4